MELLKCRSCFEVVLEGQRGEHCLQQATCPWQGWGCWWSGDAADPEMLQIWGCCRSGNAAGLEKLQVWGYWWSRDSGGPSRRAPDPPLKSVPCPVHPPRGLRANLLSRTEPLAEASRSLCCQTLRFWGCWDWQDAEPPPSSLPRASQRPQLREKQRLCFFRLLKWPIRSLAVIIYRGLRF